MDSTVLGLARLALMALLVIASPSASGIGAGSMVVDATDILALLPSGGPASTDLWEAREARRGRERGWERPVRPERRDTEPGQAPARQESRFSRIANIVFVALVLTMGGIAVFSKKWRSTWMLGMVAVCGLFIAYSEWKETGTLTPSPGSVFAVLLLGVYFLVRAWGELRHHLETRDQTLD